MSVSYDTTKLRAAVAGATPGEWIATERAGYHEILAPDAERDWYGRAKTHAVAYIDTEIAEVEAVANVQTITLILNAARNGLLDDAELGRKFRALIDAPETVEAVKDAANSAADDVDEYCTTDMATAAIAAVKTMMGEVM